jgi:tRNA(Arg) A34 adenosine deaminase TadA
MLKLQDQTDIKFLARAVQLARENVAIGGGPFGAVIVKDGEVVAESANQVIAIPDPTAHAEVQTIRLAAKNINSFNLSGTTLYTSCEPCPMCLGAIYWSRISRVVFASDRHDADLAGFRDDELYEAMTQAPEERKIHFEQVDVPEKGLEFTDWNNSHIKIDY